MRGALLARIGLAAVATIALAVPANASGQGTTAVPKLTLTENCESEPHFWFTLEGLPPNTPTRLDIHLDGELMGTGEVITNANGGYSFGLGLSRPATWTITVIWAGGTLEDSLHVDCTQPEEPTSKKQCKKGGWRTFPQFKNQGQCVAFVQRSPT